MTMTTPTTTMTSGPRRKKNSVVERFASTGARRRSTRNRRHHSQHRFTAPTCGVRAFLVTSFLVLAFVLREHMQLDDDYHGVLLRAGGGGGTSSARRVLNLMSLPSAIGNYYGGRNASLAAAGQPSLSDLIGERMVKTQFIKNIGSGNVQFVLDFVVSGFPKTATTYLKEWLSNDTDRIAMYPQEILALQKHQPVRLVKLMYELPQDKIRGYKSPQDISTKHCLEYFTVHWPNSTLIVGIRHPVLWFESYYNYRITQNYSLPPADSYDFLGGCTKGTFSVCTDVSRFHKYLSALGKTPLNTKEEQELVGHVPKTFYPKRGRVPNPVFLYEISQIYDDDETRSEQFAVDLGRALGLEGGLDRKHRPLPPEPKPRLDGHIDICESRYAALRRELMKNAREASTWIRTYFLAGGASARDVTVSSPEYFEELLERWMHDPCDGGGGGSSGSSFGRTAGLLATPSSGGSGPTEQATA